jgi:hypothetical protein
VEDLRPPAIPNLRLHSLGQDQDRGQGLRHLISIDRDRDPNPVHAKDKNDPVVKIDKINSSNNNSLSNSSNSSNNSQGSKNNHVTTSNNTSNSLLQAIIFPLRKPKIVACSPSLSTENTGYGTTTIISMSSVECKTSLDLTRDVATHHNADRVVSVA